eukprot:4910925-Pyramimonas_sp.AAC.1
MKHDNKQDSHLDGMPKRKRRVPPSLPSSAHLLPPLPSPDLRAPGGRDPVGPRRGASDLVWGSPLHRERHPVVADRA